MAETPEHLTTRWQSGIWKDALNAILREAAQTTRRISAGFLRSLPLPQIDGRLDLRGVPFYEPIHPPIGGHDKGTFRLFGEEYRDIDFSYATMRFYSGDTKLTNSLFIGATLESCDFWNSDISFCMFNQAYMPWLGISRGTTILKSAFDHSKVLHYGSINGFALFQSCSFLELDWRMINFRGCRFSDCCFTGHLQKAHSQRPQSEGFGVLRNFLSKRRNDGYNVFLRCAFENLKVTRFSVQDGSLTMHDCTGFPTCSVPSKEGQSYKDFYSDNAKPRSIP